MHKSENFFGEKELYITQRGVASSAAQARWGMLCKAHLLFEAKWTGVGTGKKERKGER